MSSSGNAHLDFSDTDSLGCTAASPPALRIEASLTIHPDPGNVANIRRLIAMYKNHIDILTDILPSYHDGIEQLYGAAVYHMIPDERVKLRVIFDITKKQELRKSYLVAICKLRDKSERLEDVLKCTNKHHDKFRAKMETFKYKLLFV